MKFTEWLSLKEVNYPSTTLQMDKMGGLHMWRGSVKPIQTGKYSFAVDGKEADVYVQNQDDVHSVLGSLTGQEKGELEKGYPIVTNNITDEYF